MAEERRHLLKEPSLLSLSGNSAMAKLTNTVLLAVRVFSRWVSTADGVNQGVSIIGLLVLTKTAT
jgi:hypothetical protein